MNSFAKKRRGYRFGRDRALLVVGLLFGLILVVDFAVVVTARAELPAPATHKVKAKNKKKKTPAPTPTAEVKGKPISATDLKRYQYCGADSDCVKANNGCCDCANGGADVSVSKDRLGEFNLRFECEGVQCTEKASVPECGAGVVSCVNHQCRYFSATDFQR